MQLQIIDRENEQSLFRKIVSGENKEHILFVSGQAGMGKTSLLRLFLKICAESKTSAIALDMKGGNLSILEILARITQTIGEDKFKNLNDQMEILTSKSVTSARKFVWGSREIQVSLGGLSLENRRESNSLITDAFFVDIANYIEDKPLVVLIDSYENAGPELADWFSRIFLSHAVPLRNLIIVVAGRNLPIINNDQQDFLINFELEPIAAKYWFYYAQQLGIEVSEAYVLGMTDALNGHPVSMSMALSTLAASTKEGK